MACDCEDAVPLTIAKASHYGPTQPPHGFGALQEISTPDKKSEISFAEEHNSAWYLLNIKIDGELEFEIIPVDTTDDYDFLLYEYKDSSFCDKLLKKMIIPTRSNISNNSHRNGVTGLSVSATQEYHGQGPGDPFSKMITVHKGEKYMLVLDNVTPSGKGHTINFYNIKRVVLKGTVLDEENKPVIANVKLTDIKGATVAQTSSDATGNYAMQTELQEHIDYNLTISNDSMFIGTRVINTNQLGTEKTFTEIKTVLPKLKKGAKYPLGNINFYPGAATLLPQSMPAVEALLHLMLANKHMTILIEGHVNAVGVGDVTGPMLQDLSEERAATVKNYLSTKGIDARRMQTVGMAGRHMLYPNAETEEQMSANRRVEIKVISVKGE